MNTILAFGLVPLFLAAAWVRAKAIPVNPPWMRGWFIASIVLAVVSAVFYLVVGIVGPSNGAAVFSRLLQYFVAYIVWIAVPAASTWKTKSWRPVREVAERTQEASDKTRDSLTKG